MSPFADRRFPYDNVKITKGYHYIAAVDRGRDVFDFNPTLSSGCGSIGLNHRQRYRDGDHQIIPAFNAADARAAASASQKNKTNPPYTVRFLSVGKGDRPFAKNSQRLTQGQKEALYTQRSGCFTSEFQAAPLDYSNLNLKRKPAPTRSSQDQEEQEEQEHREPTIEKNKYKNLQVIGGGAHGVIYKARDESTGQIVAIK